MFAARYFPARYFAPRYFPEVGANTDTGSGTAEFSFTATGAGARDSTGNGTAEFSFTAIGVPPSTSDTGSGTAVFSFTASAVGIAERPSQGLGAGGVGYPIYPGAATQREKLKKKKPLIPEPVIEPIGTDDDLLLATAAINEWMRDEF